jgi:hypothetical protein
MRKQYNDIMGLAHYDGQGLRSRANLDQAVSTVNQKTASSSSSIFRRLVARESCKDEHDCEPSGSNSLVIPIVVAIMYATNRACVYEMV